MRCPAEGDRWNDKEEASSSAAQWLRAGEAVAVELDKSVAEWVAVTGGKFTEKLFREDVIWVCGKGGDNRLENWVRSVAICPCRRWGKERFGDKGQNIFHDCSF